MKKEFKKKLSLKKESVARLNNDELSGVKGGNSISPCFTDRVGCPGPNTYDCQSEYCTYNCWTESPDWHCT